VTLRSIRRTFLYVNEILIKMIAELFAENSEIVDKCDYYVPTFYIGDVKITEGVSSKEAIKKLS